MMIQTGEAMPLTIDLQFLHQTGVIAAYLLRSADEAALIDVGPSSTVPHLLAALAAAEVDPRSVRSMLITHVHLDHAGAAGLLLDAMPQATVYVHEAGARHLADPSRLLDSARRVYGKLTGKLWGEVVPVPTERLVPLHDQQVLEVADRRLQVLATPGHAIHHAAFRDLDDGSIYAGDVAGVRLPGSGYVRPPAPPPDLDLDAWEASIDRLAAYKARALYLTHFGRVMDVASHLAQLRARLRAWERVILEAMQTGQDHQATTQALQRFSAAEAEAMGESDTAARYESAGSLAITVSGYERYLRARHSGLPTPESAR